MVKNLLRVRKITLKQRWSESNVILLTLNRYFPIVQNQQIITARATFIQMNLNTFLFRDMLYYILKTVILGRDEIITQHNTKDLHYPKH